MNDIVKHEKHEAQLERLANILKSHDALGDIAQEEQSLAAQEILKMRELVLILLAHAQSPFAGEMGLFRSIVKARRAAGKKAEKVEIWRVEVSNYGGGDRLFGWTNDGELLRWNIKSGILGSRELWEPLDEDALEKGEREKGSRYIGYLKRAIAQCEGYLQKRKQEIAARKSMLSR